MGYEKFYQLVNVAQPAAGLGLRRKIPGETWERFIFGRVTLTTGAAVANRLPFLDFLDGDGNTIARWMTQNAQAASVTTGYTFAIGGNSAFSGTPTEQGVEVADALLYPGFSLLFGCVGIQAADQFSSAALYVCRYPSGDWAESPGATPYGPHPYVSGT